MPRPTVGAGRFESDARPAGDYLRTMSDPTTADGSTAPDDHDYPDPAQVARRLAETTREMDAPGVARDSLMDAAQRAGAQAHALRSMYVQLDGVADNLGLLPDDVQRDVRHVQQHTLALAEWCEAFERELQAERDEVPRR